MTSVIEHPSATSNVKAVSKKHEGEHECPPAKRSKPDDQDEVQKENGNGIVTASAGHDNVRFINGKCFKKMGESLKISVFCDFSMEKRDFCHFSAGISSFPLVYRQNFFFWI